MPTKTTAEKTDAFDYVLIKRVQHIESIYIARVAKGDRENLPQRFVETQYFIENEPHDRAVRQDEFSLVPMDLELGELAQAIVDGNFANLTKGAEDG